MSTNVKTEITKIRWIPFYCPMLKRDITFRYCTEIEYVAMGLVDEDFLVDGDDITQEIASKFCLNCTAKKNTDVEEIN